ncbi:MAG: hypothetical protein RL701_7615 [Pseudomonadota bacterium]|jgi:hypothetical protein
MLTCLKSAAGQSTLLVVLVCLAATAACSARNAPVQRGSYGTAGSAHVADGGSLATATPVCAAANSYCSTAPVPVIPAAPGCSPEPIDLTPAGVNIMVAIDGSASMATHWTRIQTAVKALRRSHPNAAVGLQVFWAEVTESFEAGVSKNNWCGLTSNHVLDVGPNTEQQLIDFLGTEPPGPAFLGGLFETSPVVEPLNYFLTHASKLADPTRTNYLLFVTDGNDNCFGSVFANKADKLVAFQKLAVELTKLNIRVVPVGFDAASMPDSDGTFGTTPPNTDLDVLGTLLKYGGTGLAEVPKVDDPSKLSQVIEQVGQQVRNCRFEIPAVLDTSLDVNPFQLDFSVNGQLVTRDRRNLTGWNFVDGSTSQVELFGPACEAVRAGRPLEAHKTCSQDVCGTAAIKVETRPRAVLLLLDASASRIECADGTLDCLVLPGTGTPRTLTFWEVV